MSTISYLKGDATAPIGEGNKIVVHICNDVGGWGKGFVLALSKRWKEPEHQYRQWAKSVQGLMLGQVQLVQVSPEIWVGNMIGQQGIYPDASGTPPIRYTAVEDALATVGDHALQLQASVHMPRIGCGLAGGTWDKIEPIIERTLLEKSVAVTVYDF